MVLTFLLLGFLATTRGIPLTPKPLHSTRAKADGASVYTLGRDLPECLKLYHYRTTSQIIWSCVATVFACTWVANHPNLPGPYDTGFQQFRRKVTITLLAIMAPELIVIFATGQRDAAKGIKREFNEKFNNGDDPELSLLGSVISCFTIPFHVIKGWFAPPPEKVYRKWTLTHGFFVQMGGFMMYHDGKPVQVLTFDRLLKAIEAGDIDIPHIPEEDILEKSKGNGPAKLVVVLQTIWFVAQCVGRWTSGLPISELEVSTLAFAVLNAYVYAIWWSKPQGVLEPIKLEFRVCPLPSNDDPQPDDPSQPSSLPAPCYSGSSNSKEPSLAPAARLSDAESASLPERSGDDQRDQSVGPVLEVKVDKGSLHWILHSIAELPPHSGSIQKKMQEFLLCVGIILLYPFRVAAKAVGHMTSKTNSNNTETKFLVGKSRVPMFYVDPHHLSGGLIYLFSFIIIPPIFGGIHITLWSATFPTSLERILWRICAFYVTATPLLILPGQPLKDVHIRHVRPSAPYFLILFLYPVARATLIFISVYTLRHLSEHTYYDVHWTTLLPHI